MKKCTSFEEQKGTRYIRRKVYFLELLSLAVFRLENRLSDFFNLFAREIKSFYQSYFGNEIDFRDIMNVFPNILAKKLKFQKLEARFCRWKSRDNNGINIFLLLEKPCSFLLAKEKIWKPIFKTNSELLQIRTKKQIMPSKATINWLLNVVLRL